VPQNCSGFGDDPLDGDQLVATHHPTQMRTTQKHSDMYPCCRSIPVHNLTVPPVHGHTRPSPCGRCDRQLLLSSSSSPYHRSQTTVRRHTDAPPAANWAVHSSYSNTKRRRRQLAISVEKLGEQQHRTLFANAQRKAVCPHTHTQR